MRRAGLDAERLLTMLEELATRLGIEIRYERFERDALGIRSRGGARGGLCRIRGDLVVLMDEDLDVPDRVAVLARALAGFDLETIYVPPIVRRAILAHGYGIPTKFRPLVKARKRI